MAKKMFSLPARKWGFIGDAKLRHILARDYSELRRLQEMRAHKSTIVMCGSILEALLVYILSSEAARLRHQEKHGQKPSVETIEGAGLKSLIARATDLGFLDEAVGDQAGIVKDYRNLIHPVLERQSKVDISDHSVAAVLGLFNHMIHLLSKGPGGRSRNSAYGTLGKSAFFTELSRHVEPEDIQVVQSIYDWADSNKLEQAWQKSLTYLPLLHHSASQFKLFAIPVRGKISIRFGFLLRTNSPFRSRECRLELLQRLNAIPGVHIGLEKLDKFPSIRTSVLRSQAARQQFLEVLDWMKQTIVMPSSQ